MTESTQSFEAESWAFALQIYAEPGIAEACLRLQAEAGVDVMMLLTAAFAAVRRGIVLQASDIQDMDEACRPWREQIVQPLRALRVALKSGPSPAPVPATEKLRSQIKASELAAEQLQNDLLAAWLQQKAPAQQAVSRMELHAVLCSVVLLALQKRESGQIDRLLPAIDDIAAAAKGIAS
ncbi:uncharacterized protein (TIGR02444 family) [Nitrobacteraceae bacterium AZCC 2161]